VFAGVRAFHALRRQRLWAAHHGSAVPLAALLAFAALRSPGATLLTVPAPPAPGDLAGAASGIVGGGCAGLSRHVTDYVARGFVTMLWPAWLPRPGPGAPGRRDGAKTRSQGSGGGGSSGGMFGGKLGVPGVPQGRGQPQAGSHASRHSTGNSSKGSGRAGGSAGADPAARPWTGPGAAALLPLRLGARQLLAAMAAPPLLSLVSWVPTVSGVGNRICQYFCQSLCRAYARRTHYARPPIPDAKVPADSCMSEAADPRDRMTSHWACVRQHQPLLPACFRPLYR
jgi:hypothetical protein